MKKLTGSDGEDWTLADVTSTFSDFDSYDYFDSSSYGSRYADFTDVGTSYYFYADYGVYDLGFDG